MCFATANTGRRSTLLYLAEVLRKAGFQEVESKEGKSRLYGTRVPAFEPGDSTELPHSLYVEAFK